MGRARVATPLHPPGTDVAVLQAPVGNVATRAPMPKKASTVTSSDEDSEDDEDTRDLEGRIYTKKGKEVSMALSAVAVVIALSSELMADCFCSDISS